MSGFLSRLLVAAAGLPVVLGAAWAGGWIMWALVALAVLLALHELYSVGRRFRPLALAGFGGAAAALLGAELGGLDWMLAGAILTLPLAFLFVLLAETRQSATVAVSFTLLGPAWIALGLGHLLLVRDIEPHGRLAVFTVLLTVFATDTAAYVFGRLAGRHRLAPVLSPGKSWEGFVAGALAGVFTSFVALYKSNLLDIGQSLVLGAVIVVAATLGDLMESLVKRDIGIKDTSRTLGAHGGVLDRIDSLLFAAPAAFYTFHVFGAV